MSTRALNLWVFRDSRSVSSGQDCKLALLNELRRAGSFDLITTLLRAGELECAVADDGGIPVEPWSKLTDQVAHELISPGTLHSPALLPIVERTPLPDTLEVSPPEGFAYYGLHPLQYAEVLEEIPQLGASLAVVGIRSIGTTLSAVTAAAARCRGKHAARITVRPTGHPYNRRTTFSSSELSFVHRNINTGSAFLVVDEGPGLSGSSFLSVAEALETAGVPQDKIFLICAHPPNLDAFCSENGPQRARRYRWVSVPGRTRRPHEAHEFIGGGLWRDVLFSDRQHWPASWTSFERLKYLSGNGSQRKLFKFLGLGHYGEDVLVRELRVAEAGFGVAPSRQDDGFVSYPWIEGRPMSAEDLSIDNIERLANYCAFRAQEFSTNCADAETLQRMSEHNLSQFDLNPEIRLRLERPVVADGRLQPYEWLLTAPGEMLKTDSGAHGDDHFFPGPTDIGWDLAGAIVEWKMNPAQSRYFLEYYREATKDDPSSRIEDFVIAYAAFRCAYCLMAANALTGSQEQVRLEKAARSYEEMLSQRAPALLNCK